MGKQRQLVEKLVGVFGVGKQEKSAQKKAKFATVSLTSLKPGDKGSFLFMEAGVKEARRLADMGLTKGTVIKLSKHAPLHGPVEILVRGTKLAIGRGIASKIYLEVE